MEINGFHIGMHLKAMFDGCESLTLMNIEQKEVQQ